MPQRSPANLLELGVVVVMLTLVASIAIPRMSRGAAGAHDTALVHSLRGLREALERYAADHGGEYPSPEHVAEALTRYSNFDGTILLSEKSPAGGVVLGPYLRAIPPLPVRCPRQGSRGIGATDAEGIGWIYSVNPAGIGQIHANTTIETDVIGFAYSAY